MSSNCLVDVARNGKYVCRSNIIDSDTCPKVVHAGNLPGPIAVEQSVAGGIEGPWSATEMVLESGVPLLLMPGTYRLDFDCADYAGVAPEAAVTICCSEMALADALAMQQTQKLCEMVDLLSVSEDAAALAQIISELQALCDKMLASIAADAAAAATSAAQLQELCEKLLKGLEQDAEHNAAELECLEQIKELLTCPPAVPRGVLTTWS